MLFSLGAVHKRRPQSKGVSSTDILRTRGGGVEPLRIFCKQGAGSNFLNFCGRLLWNAPYSFEEQQRIAHRHTGTVLFTKTYASTVCFKLINDKIFSCGLLGFQ